MTDYELDTISKKVAFDTLDSNGDIIRGEDDLLDTPRTSVYRKSPVLRRKQYPEYPEYVVSPGTSSKGRWKRMMDLDTLSAFTYLLALAVFYAAINIDGMPKLPYPFTGNIQDMELEQGMVPDVWDNALVMVIVLYGALYLRKMMLMIFRHILGPGRPRRNTMNDLSSNNNNSPSTLENMANDAIAESARQNNSIISNKCAHYVGPAFLYHIFFGFWMGWSTNTDVGYYPSDDEYLIAGFLVFLAGETLAYWVVFRYVTIGEQSSFCQRFLREMGEVIPVAGFAIFSLTLPACTFALMRFTLAVLALCGAMNTDVF